MEKVRVTFWMTVEGRELLAAAAARVGMPQGAFLEMLVRKMAEAPKRARRTR